MTRRGRLLARSPRFDRSRVGVPAATRNCRRSPLRFGPTAASFAGCSRRGFTLVEVLVALALLAVALSAGMRALAQSADSAGNLKARTLALWVAQNRLAAAQLASPPPPIGRSEGSEAQANAPFVWRVDVSATPNAAFRKIEIAVAEPDRPDYVLARIVGYLGPGEAR